MSQLPDSSFAFMDLPPEIRLHIYRVCLERRLQVPLVERKRRCDRTIRYFKYVPGAHRTAPIEGYEGTSDVFISNILRVSKQVYAEANEILYKNIFMVQLEGHFLRYCEPRVFDQRSCARFENFEIVVPEKRHFSEFVDVVRTRLRYFSGLENLSIHLMFHFVFGERGLGEPDRYVIRPEDFKVLRYLPQSCRITLGGVPNPALVELVNQHMTFARSIDSIEHRRLQEEIDPDYDNADGGWSSDDSAEYDVGNILNSSSDHTSTIPRNERRHG